MGGFSQAVKDATKRFKEDVQAMISRGIKPNSKEIWDRRQQLFAEYRTINGKPQLSKRPYPSYI